jgi:anti-anti-sigma regulatory factor
MQAAREPIGSRVPGVRVVSGVGARQASTVVLLCGEHDFGSRGLVEEALFPLEGHVLVDLSRCSFVDSAVIAILLAKSRQLESTGGRLELIAPTSQGHVLHVLERLGVGTIVSVRDRPPHAIDY